MLSGGRPESAVVAQRVVAPGSAEDRPAERMGPWMASRRGEEREVMEADREGARWIQQVLRWRQWSESTDGCLLPGPLKIRLLATFLDAGRLVRRGLARSGVVTMGTALVLGDATLAT